MIDALESGAVDLVGLARPISHDPDFPRRILDGTTEASTTRTTAIGNQAVDALLNSAWHQQQIARMGRGKKVRPGRKAWVALVIALLVTVRDTLLTKVPRP
jgi:hypothetical protein